MPRDFDMLGGELMAGAQKMIALATSAPTNPQDGAVAGDGQIYAPGASFPSQEAKNYAQAALALTQAWCTVMRAAEGGRTRAY